MTKIVLCHGFPYDDFFLKTLGTALSKDYEVQYINLGYFDTENLLSKQDCKGAIGIGHFSGFNKLLSLNYDFKGLIGIASFLHFVASINNRRMLENLSFSFDIDDQKTLQTFIQRSQEVYYPLPFNKYHKDTVKTALAELANINDTKHITDKKVLFLHGANDIVFNIDEATQQLAHHNLVVHPNAGHFLGYLEIIWCVEQIKNFINSL